MIATIEPGNIAGTIAAPPSKSMTQRAFAAALLHSGETIIRGAGASGDELAALSVIKALGAEVAQGSDGSYKVRGGNITSTATAISCGESGLATRLFTPIAAISGSPAIITGAGTLLKRPMTGFAEILPQLGVSLHDFTCYLPLHLQGPLVPKDITIDASDGSQLLSGLLFAYCKAATQPVAITVSALESKPYIDMTLQVLGRFGWKVERDGYDRFYIDPAKFASPASVAIDVEGDWSSAAFLLAAGAIAGEVTVTNIDLRSTQADKSIIQVLQEAGASMSIMDNAITVRCSPLRDFDLDSTDCPDLFPIAAILAACADGESTIRGVHRLFHKESNRMASIGEMLDSFGVPYSAAADCLFVSGVPRLRGTVVESFHDHRIAMAAAIGALRAKGRVDITDAEAVNKSFPRFFDVLTSCGVQCSTQP